MLKKNIKNFLIFTFLISSFSCNLYSMKWLSSFFFKDNTTPVVKPPLVVNDPPELSDEMAEVLYNLCPEKIQEVLNLIQLPEQDEPEIEELKRDVILLHGDNAELLRKIAPLFARKMGTKIVTVSNLEYLVPLYQMVGGKKTQRLNRGQWNSMEYKSWKIQQSLGDLIEQNKRCVFILNDAHRFSRNLIRQISDIKNNTRKTPILFVLTTTNIRTMYNYDVMHCHRINTSVEITHNPQDLRRTFAQVILTEQRGFTEEARRFINNELWQDENTENFSISSLEETFKKASLNKIRRSIEQNRDNLMISREDVQTAVNGLKTKLNLGQRETLQGNKTKQTGLLKKTGEKTIIEETLNQMKKEKKKTSLKKSQTK